MNLLGFIASKCSCGNYRLVSLRHQEGTDDETHLSAGMLSTISSLPQAQLFQHVRFTGLALIVSDHVNVSQPITLSLFGFRLESSEKDATACQTSMQAR